MGRNSNKKKGAQNYPYKKADPQPVKNETAEKSETVEEPKNFEVLEVKVTRSSGQTEQQVIAQAMEALDTFEGNLKADHTETHYVFTKVRG